MSDNVFGSHDNASFHTPELGQLELRCGSYFRSAALVASRREQVQEDVRLRVLRLLEENPELSTRDIADAVGISNGSAYYCLNALVKKGFVKLGNFTASAHKGRYAYILTPRGLREKTLLTGRFLQRKMTEYEELRREIEQLKGEFDLSAQEQER